MNVPGYNFKLAPEALWLIVNTVVGALLIEGFAYVSGMTELPAWTDFRSWLIALSISAIRTLLGVVLAVAAGQFSNSTPPKP